MGTDNDRPYAEPMSLNGAESCVYEAIATLEYLGHLVTKTEIATVADLDDATIEQTLRDLTERNFLVRTNVGGEPTFEPARRGWSAVPDKGEGYQL